MSVQSIVLIYFTILVLKRLKNFLLKVTSKTKSKNCKNF